jgi:serine/threonine-protein kinase
MRWKTIALEEGPMKTACMLGVLMLSLALCYLAVHAEDNFAQGATVAAETWLGHVDTGDYAGSWREASAYVQRAITEHAWVASLQRVRTPLGPLLSRQLTQVQHTQSMPGAPDGDYVVMQFDTRFANKQAAVETVTFMQEKQGEWKAAGYYIK